MSLELGRIMPCVKQQREEGREGIQITLVEDVCAIHAHTWLRKVASESQV